MDPQRRNKADVTLALFSVCADDKSLRFLEKNIKKNQPTGFVFVHARTVLRKITPHVNW